MRPLSPYPSNFPMPYPFPEMNPNLRPSSDIRQPIVVDLLTSTEEKSDAKKVETMLKSAGKDVVANNSNGTGKVATPEVSNRQSFDKSNYSDLASPDASRSIVGSSEQPIASTSDITNNFTTVCESNIQKPMMLNSNPNEEFEKATTAKAISSAVINPDIITTNQYNNPSSDILTMSTTTAELGPQSNHTLIMASDTVQQLLKTPQNPVIFAQSAPLIDRNGSGSALTEQNSERVAQVENNLPTTNITADSIM